MIKIREIEKSVSHLPLKELAEFRTWFHKFDAIRWDRQFEEDVRAGKLDALAGKAIADFQKGKFEEL